jgi:hypothetical protein
LVQGNSSLPGDGPVKYEKDFQKNGNGFLLELSKPRKISFEIYFKLPLQFEDQITRQITASVIICGAEEVSAKNDDSVTFEYTVGPGEGQEYLTSVADYFKIEGNEECTAPGLTYQLTTDTKGTRLGAALPILIQGG